MKSEDALFALAEARSAGRGCVLVTVVGAKGSAPREVGAKMLVLGDGSIVETVGGGKFEALVVAEALARLAGEGDGRGAGVKRFVLHEGDAESFGAICGGEVEVFFDLFPPVARMVIVGAGHCGEAIAGLAVSLGYAVVVVDDRETLWGRTSGVEYRGTMTAVKGLDEFGARDAVLMVSRNWEIDTRALAAALEGEAGYIGMIGSQRKVRQVYATLREEGVEEAALGRVFAPIGLAVGANTPAEIAVSVMAEVLQVRNEVKGGHLRISARSGGRAGGD